MFIEIRNNQELYFTTEPTTEDSKCDDDDDKCESDFVFEHSFKILTWMAINHLKFTIAGKITSTTRSKEHNLMI